MGWLVTRKAGPMELELGFEERDGYLFVRGRGPLDPASVRQALVQIKDRATKSSLTRTLIDAAEARLPFRDIDRFLAGTLIAEFLPRPFKLVVVYRSDLINKFAENTA